MTARSTVDDVMTTDVISVSPDTGYQHIVNLLIGHEISAVPVVDDDRHVLGIVSEADLATKVEYASLWPVRHRRSLDGGRRAVARTKSTADTARELMTAPAVTIYAEASLAAAARLMADAEVKRLPVVDSHHRLIGIVSRRDLLRTHLRSDLQIRADVAEVLRDWFHLEASIAVVDGVVTVVGEVTDQRQADLAIKFASAVDGVVDVVDGLLPVSENNGGRQSTPRRGTAAGS